MEEVTCTKPPAGWHCTRGAEHCGKGGPCAAIPDSEHDTKEDQASVREHFTTAYRNEKGLILSGGFPNTVLGTSWRQAANSFGPVPRSYQGQFEYYYRSDIDPLLAAAKDIEMQYREIMWLSHGHFGLYGDDGEMQCSECGTKYKCWDYKRDTLDRVRVAYHAACMERMEKAMKGSNG